MPFRRCPTPADAIAAYDRTVAEAGTALFLVFGSADPQTGESWCADCQVADPILRAAIHRARSGLITYECPVGQRSEWKNQPQHPLRTHAGLQIARIPTLVLIEGGIETGRLVEADCARPESVAAFLAVAQATGSAGQPGAGQAG